ncbi:hypothetical protein [Mycobacterium sp.]|uniref:hypothetical protein n=1 Tax=Mycobacterium sp. TaxID=1785 RepID=UPI003F96CAE1
MTDTTRDLQPVAVDKLAGFDYATRVAALNLTRAELVFDPPHWQRADISEMLASAPDAPEVIRCLIALAAAAFLEHAWQGRDPESAEYTITREIQIAEDLAAGPPFDDWPPTWVRADWPQ